MRTVVLTHKIVLDPNAAQEEFFRRAVGVARFAYNWALEMWTTQYEAGLKPNEAALRCLINNVKRDEFPWMYDVPKSVVQQAIKNLGTAFQKFFRQADAGYPQFKCKGKHDSARLDNGPGTFLCKRKRVKLPVIGWVKMREALRFEGKPLSATISRVANHWYVSIPVQMDIEEPIRENQASIGIDLGVSCAATCSDGRKLDAPKALKKHLKQLQHLSRQHSRKVKGSKNRKRSAMKLARLHARIAAIRQNWLHQTTTALVRAYTLIGIEDLNVAGMLKNHRLARAISDIGFGEFRRQLTYKADLYGSVVVAADRWYPSSKTCSVCGHKVSELPLNIRSWVCLECGAHHDRDINAARNLQQIAEATVSYTGSEACQTRGSRMASGQESALCPIWA